MGYKIIPNSNKKILIFIVAYNAEKTISHVLQRIPRNLFTKYDYEILIIDDCSTDKTFYVCSHYKSDNPDTKINLFLNSENQGYGGNQKLGYHYAVENHFDTVILIHGDGQYPPELIEEAMTPILNEKAHAVFGSRMIGKNQALKGGMPFYKFIGNKILTWFQNTLLGTKLTEFHSGYRAYSVKALAQIPFERNSNDFHFDTQIIIQFIKAKLEIKEISIPTFYGDEICHVNGLKYAKDVAISTILAQLHDMNITYRREYDVITDNSIYDLKLGHDSSHTYAINTVKEGSKVLDIGCGPSLIARELKRKNCFVDGIDIYPLSNKKYLDNYKQCDLNNAKLLPSVDHYDVVLLLDIIEHFISPENFLDELRKKSKNTRPRIIMTTGNIAFFLMRLNLLFGRFNYGKRGILDMTHTRLYTFHSLKKLLNQCGFTILKSRGVPAPFPKALGDNWFGHLLVRINKLLIFFSRNLFSYQIYMECFPKPSIDVLLDHSSSKGSEESQKWKMSKKTVSK